MAAKPQPIFASAAPWRFVSVEDRGGNTENHMAAKPQPIRTVKKDLHGTPETAPPGEEPADRAQFDPYSGFPVLLGFRVIFAHTDDDGFFRRPSLCARCAFAPLR